MEFKVICPEDGQVGVSLEDVSTVILRNPEIVDIVFDCPVCGASISVSLRLPNLLMSALESLEEAAESGRGFASFVVVSAESVDGQLADSPEIDDPEHIDSYCEYFRRQLSTVGCVEEALQEME